MTPADSVHCLPEDEINRGHEFYWESEKRQVHVFSAAGSQVHAFPENVNIPLEHLLEIRMEYLIPSDPLYNVKTNE